MSTIVTMSQTVGEYISGSTYRLRTKEASIIAAAAQGTIVDNVPEPANTIEGE